MDTKVSLRAREMWIIEVEAIAALWNPMRDDVWGCGYIDPTDVLACPDISLGQLPAELAVDAGSKDYNIARIAWLMHHGWDEDIEPISLEIWPESIEDWPVLWDGNHRFAAALIAGTKYVKVEVTGDMVYLQEKLHPVSRL